MEAARESRVTAAASAPAGTGAPDRSSEAGGAGTGTSGTGTSGRGTGTAHRSEAADQPPRDEALDHVERQTAVLVRHIELLYRRTDVHDTLDRAEYLLLRTLDDSGPMNINALAAVVGLDPSTAGRQVSVLQKAGFVARSPDPADRRCSVVTPTAEGLARMREVQTKRTENHEYLLRDWTDEDVQTLGAILAKYNTSVAEKYLTGSALIEETAAGK